MTKYTTIIKVAHVAFTLVLFSTCNALGLVVPVPDKEELLEKADMAIVCKISEVEGKFYAQVVEALKGGSVLPGKSVEVISPYPVMSFPLAKWQAEDKGKEVLLVGRWNDKEKHMVLIYGAASYWPRGMPDTVSKTKTIQEGRSIITEHGRKQTAPGSVPNNRN